MTASGGGAVQHGHWLELADFVEKLDDNLARSVLPGCSEARSLRVCGAEALPVIFLCC